MATTVRGEAVPSFLFSQWPLALLSGSELPGSSSQYALCEMTKGLHLGYSLQGCDTTNMAIISLKDESSAVNIYRTIGASCLVSLAIFESVACVLLQRLFHRKWNFATTRLIMGCSGEWQQFSACSTYCSCSRTLNSYPVSPSILTSRRQSMSGTCVHLSLLSQ